jgi:hypothetical protein
MQAIDRLGWAAGLGFEAYGLTIGVRVNAPAVPADVLDCLPPTWRPLDRPFVSHLLSLRLGGPGPRPGSRNFFLLYAGPAQVVRTLDRATALGALENELQTAVATGARDRVFVHAGVVGWRGRAIVLPGRSFAGKSTLVRALLAAGATYYSDEFAVLDPKGRVHPYPRRLSLRRDGAGPARPTAADLGAETGTRPLPVGLVAFTEYRPGADWRPRPLSPARTLFELAANTRPEVSQSRLGRDVLERLAVSAPAVQTRRGDAAAAAAEILRTADWPPTASPWRRLFARAA